MVFSTDIWTSILYDQVSINDMHDNSNSLWRNQSVVPASKEYFVTPWNFMPTNTSPTKHLVDIIDNQNLNVPNVYLYRNHNVFSGLNAYFVQSFFEKILQMWFSNLLVSTFTNASAFSSHKEMLFGHSELTLTSIRTSSTRIILR